jgi:hypothetical protein
MRGISINRNIFVVRKDDTKAYLDTDHDREFKVQLLFSLQYPHKRIAIQQKMLCF